jgi:protein HIRA/HIR1
LERRIDAKDGIFRKWGQDMPLSSQSLFRRLSWSTDGMHILTTNATVKNKHVASTISREQWTSTATTAAHLVGHQQPVVVASHAPILLQGDTSANDDEDPDEEPSYATLVALGDKKGFVTIWSTRKSRPLFKLQCSEGRRTVTDLSWGVAKDHLVLAVGLLDGQVVMLRLSVPEEVGPLLSKASQAKLFRLRYGIDTNDPTSYGRLMDDGRPKLIETALQMTLEEEEEDHDDEEDEPVPPPNITGRGTVNHLLGRSKKDGRKKRVQPLLLTVQKKSSVSAPPPRKKVKPTKTSALQHAQEVADKMAATRTNPSSKSNKVTVQGPVSPPTSPIRQVTQTATVPVPGSASMMTQVNATILPHSMDRIHTVDLELKPGLLVENPVRWTAECHNRASQVPLGARGPGLPCVDVSLRRDGRSVWQDQIVGTSCCAMAGNERILAVGCTDGCIQLYGTSPVSGWGSESAVRAFPPLVIGHPIIALEIKAWEGSPTLLMVAVDGSFGVYRLEPTFGKVFSGSILPAMSHMAYATLSRGERTVIYPKLSRCQMTDKGQILLLLSNNNITSSGDGDELNSSNHSTVGGSIQGFVFHRDLELWMRISDSRFVLSDFYSSLPLRQNAQEPGPLSRLDDAVRLGAMEASVKPSQRRRQDTSTTLATMYTMSTDGGSGNFVPTKAHCEDRLACAIALQSASEFRQWLACYAKTLASGGQEQLLRTLVDVLLSDVNGSGWWLSTGLGTFDLDRKELLRKVVLPAMSKNRALQRLTNELAVELNQGL